MSEPKSAEPSRLLDVTCPRNGATVPQTVTVLWTVDFVGWAYYFVLEYAGGGKQCFGPYTVNEGDTPPFSAQLAANQTGAASLSVYRVPVGTQGVDCSNIECGREPISVVLNLTIQCGAPNPCPIPDPPNKAVR